MHREAFCDQTTNICTELGSAAVRLPSCQARRVGWRARCTPFLSFRLPPSRLGSSFSFLTIRNREFVPPSASDRAFSCSPPEWLPSSDIEVSMCRATELPCIAENPGARTREWNSRNLLNDRKSLDGVKPNRWQHSEHKPLSRNSSRSKSEPDQLFEAISASGGSISEFCCSAPNSKSGQ